MNSCKYCGADIFPGASDCPRCSRSSSGESENIDDSKFEAAIKSAVNVGNGLAFLFWFPLMLAVGMSFGAPGSGKLLHMIWALSATAIGPAFLYSFFSSRNKTIGWKLAGVFIVLTFLFMGICGGKFAC